MILFSWGTQHDCKPSTQETEVGLLPVQGQPGLHGKTEGWGGASFVKKKKKKHSNVYCLCSEQVLGSIVAWVTVFTHHGDWNALLLGL